MKKNFLLLGALLSISTLFAQELHISTPSNSLVLSAPIGGNLKYIYYGDKLSDTELPAISKVERASHSAYPVYGMRGDFEPALAVKHSDGNMTLQMEIVSVNTQKEENANLTVVRMKDKIYPFFTDICYKAYQDVDVIEIWTEITHKEKKEVQLNQFASAYLPIRRGNVWI